MTIQPEQIRAEIRAAISGVVQAELDPRADDVPLSSRFEQYDSLGVLDCVGLIEQRLGVSIDLVDDDLRNTFLSVTTIEELVARKLADKAVLEDSF